MIYENHHCLLMLFIQRHAGLDLSSRSKGRNIVCAMASVTDNNVCIILKKTHFVFREIEKPGGLLCFLYTRFLPYFPAVRASRHSRNGRFAVQGGLFRNAITALLQGETALSAFLTKPCCCNMLIISTPCLKQKTRFSEPCPEIAIRMSLNIR